jgi:hypothetical protein
MAFLLRLCACACLLTLGACTVPFTPGDAKPGTYTPTRPVDAASAPGPSRY